jgi:hypothetical protein
VFSFPCCGVLHSHRKGTSFQLHSGLRLITRRGNGFCAGSDESDSEASGVEAGGAPAAGPSGAGMGSLGSKGEGPLAAPRWHWAAYAGWALLMLKVGLCSRRVRGNFVALLTESHPG